MFKGRSFLVKMVKDDEAGHEEEVDVTEDIRSHFQKNKNAYIAGIAGIAFASITCHYIGGRNAVAGNAASDGLDRVTIRPLSFFSKQSNNVIAVIEKEGPGHPGYITHCVETGKDFATQGEAARAYGINSKTMSWHMNNKLENANGLHFNRTVPVLV